MPTHHNNEDDDTLRDGQRLRVPLVFMDGLQQSVAAHFGPLHFADVLDANRPGYRRLADDVAIDPRIAAYEAAELRDAEAYKKCGVRDDDGPNGFGSVAFRGAVAGAPCMTASGEAGTVAVDDDGYLFCKALDPSPAAGPEPRIDSRDGESAVEREYRLYDAEVAARYKEMSNAK